MLYSKYYLYTTYIQNIYNIYTTYIGLRWDEHDIFPQQTMAAKPAKERRRGGTAGTVCGGLKKIFCLKKTLSMLFFVFLQQ